MTSGRIVDTPGRPVKNTIPDRKKQAVLLIHLKRVIERAQNLAGQTKVCLWQRLGSQSIHGRYREQSRADAVAAHIKQIKGKMVIIEPMVAERVAP